MAQSSAIEVSEQDQIPASESSSENQGTQPTGSKKKKRFSITYSTLVTYALCLSGFCYFAIPILQGYFRYETSTITYFPSTYPDFPDMTIYLQVTDPLFSKEYLLENLKVNEQTPILDTARYDSNSTTYRVQNSSPNYKDLLFRWDKFESLEDVNQALKDVKLIRELSNTWNGDKPMLFMIENRDVEINESRNTNKYMRRMRVVRVEILARIGPPYNLNCKNYDVKFGKVTIASQKQCFTFCRSYIPCPECVECRDVNIPHLCSFCNIEDCIKKNEISFVAAGSKFPSVLFMNSFNIVHQSNITLDLKMLLIYIFGLLGMFLDISSESFTNHLASIEANVNNAKVLKLRISSKMLLFIAGFVHVIVLSYGYFNYSISTAVYIGEPFKFPTYVPQLCSDDVIPISLLNNRRVVVSAQINNKRTGSYFLKADLEVKNCFNVVRNWTLPEIRYFPSRIALVYRVMSTPANSSEQGIDLIFNFKQGSMSSNIPIFLPLGETALYELFFYRGRYLVAPFETKCRDYLKLYNCSSVPMCALKFRTENTRMKFGNSLLDPMNEQRFRYPNCVEESFFGEKNVRKKSPSTLVLFHLPSSSIEILTVAQISLADWISCIFTAISFWLGICIFDLCREHIVSRFDVRYIKLLAGYLILTLLSSCLLYHLYTRFDDYFKHESISSITSVIPTMLEVPPLFLLFLSLFTNATNSNLKRGSWMPRDVNLLYPENIDLFDGVFLGNQNEKSRTEIHLTDVLKNSVGDFIEGSRKLVSLNFGAALSKVESKGRNRLVIKFSSLEKIAFGAPIIRHDSPLNFDAVTFVTTWTGLYIRTRASKAFYLRYSKTQLLPPPYDTKCKVYGDPETDESSWFNCMIRGLNRTVSFMVLLPAKSNVTIKSGLNDAFLEAQCMNRFKMEPDCISIEPTWEHLPENSTSDLILEQSYVTKCIFSPKTDLVNFLILIFDAIGFWLGLSVLFFLNHFFKFSTKILRIEKNETAEPAQNQVGPAEDSISQVGNHESKWREKKISTKETSKVELMEPNPIGRECEIISDDQTSDVDEESPPIPATPGNREFRTQSTNIRVQVHTISAMIPCSLPDVAD